MNYLEAEVERAGSQLLAILFNKGVECAILIETQYIALDLPVLGPSISQDLPSLRCSRQRHQKARDSSAV